MFCIYDSSIPFNSELFNLSSLHCINHNFYLKTVFNILIILLLISIKSGIY